MSRRPTVPVRREPRPPRRASRPAPPAAFVPASRPAPSPHPAPSPPPARPSPAVATSRRVPVVTDRSTERFAERARRVRRVRARPVLTVLLVAVVSGVLAWVVLASSLLAVRDVGVTGAERVDLAGVRAVAESAVGTPLARVDTDALTADVERFPQVASADVVRVWPGSLEVRLTERVPVAAVPEDGGVVLVDSEGVELALADAPPADLPVLDVDPGPDAATSRRAAAAVMGGLPPDLRGDVEQVGASSPEDVRLRLRDGAEVVWGGATQGRLKARVLEVLRQQGAAVYDVSAPRTPVTR